MAKKNVSTVVSIGTTYTSQHLLTEHQEIHHFLDAAYKIFRPEIGSTEDFLLISAISKLEDLIYHYEERAELDTDSFEQSLKAQGGAV